MLQYTVLDLVKRPFVIYKDTMTNQCSLDARRGITNKKVMCIAFPHAGAHLFQEMMTMMGSFHVRIMYEKDSIGDYRFLSDMDRKKFARLYDSYMFPFRDTCKWIVDGQFVHNHLKYDDTIFQNIKDAGYTAYLMKRNLRDCVVSHARRKQRDNPYLFGMNPESHMRQNLHPKKLMETYIKLPYCNEFADVVKSMFKWFTSGAFKVLVFEDIVGRNGNDAQYRAIMGLMNDMECKYFSSDEIINKCVCKHTFTYSGTLSKWNDYWSDDVESWFNKSGLKKCNTDIGYE